MIFPPAGKFCAGTNRPKPAPAGRMLCRLSCTVSCIFPGRRCFSPQRVVLYFYLYPRGFMGGCPGNPRGVAKMGGTKRPVLTLGEYRRHSGHKTRNALGLERGAWVRLPPSPPVPRRLISWDFLFSIYRIGCCGNNSSGLFLYDNMIIS